MMLTCILKIERNFIAKNITSTRFEAWILLPLTKLLQSSKH